MDEYTIKIDGNGDIYAGGGVVNLNDLAKVKNGILYDTKDNLLVDTTKLVTTIDSDGIVSNTASIATNKTDIATNKTDIATNKTDISTNTTSIATNANSIVSNTNNITTNTSNIINNATSITSNTSAIAGNTTDIATLNTEILDFASKDGDVTKVFKVADAVNDNDAINKKQLDDQVSLSISVATIIISPISTIPQGFIECNGAAVSRTTYANLFTKIGTAYGAGDGSTTFTIPDLRGVFVRGWDHGRGIDSGRSIGSYQGDSFKSHKHNSYGGSASNGGNTGGYGDGGSQVAATSYTGGTETRPKNIAMMYCIKY